MSHMKQVFNSIRRTVGSAVDRSLDSMERFLDALDGDVFFERDANIKLQEMRRKQRADSGAACKSLTLKKILSPPRSYKELQDNGEI